MKIEYYESICNQYITGGNHWLSAIPKNTFAYRILNMINSTYLNDFILMYARLVHEAERKNIYGILPSFINDTKLTYINAKRKEFMKKFKIISSRNVYVSPLFRKTFTYGISPSKLWMKVIPDAKSHEAAKFLALYNFHRLPKNEYELKVVEGKDLLKYYQEDSYYSLSGILGKSCMKQSRKNEFMKLYANNTNNIKMLVMLDRLSNLVLARALLWSNVIMKDNDEINNHEKYINFMDRVYCIDQTNHEPYMLNWAKENGYYTRDSRAGFSDCITSIEGKLSYVSLKIKLQSLKFKHYPYTDTFRYIDPKQTMLISDITNFKLSSVNGHYKEKIPHMSWVTYPGDAGNLWKQLDNNSNQDK